MRRAVLDLAAGRPTWRFGLRETGAMRRALGRGWDVAVVQAPTDSDGDGGSASDEAIAAARGAEVYVGWGVPLPVVRAATDSLRWAHTASVGVGAALTPAFLATGALLTNGRGILDEPMADWVLAAMGVCLRGFLPAIAARQDGRWIKDAFTDGSIRPREFAGTRVGLVGLGGVGSAVARRAHRLGMEVRAVRRRRDGRRPAGVRWVGGPTQLGTLAARSDVLVLAAPATAITRTLVEAEALDRLPHGAYLINVARGSLVDERAVVARLTTGQLAGYVTDVAGEEPPRRESPLWTHPGVLITPHVSGVTPAYQARATALIVDNLQRYRRGRRLRNVVDLAAGY
ncbi:MAG: NAD(P)-dependent oxidoreductase [Gemmatimonadales bacterium]